MFYKFTFYEFFSRRLQHSTFYECTFAQSTFYRPRFTIWRFRQCSYKSVLQLYSLNMYVLQSPFLFYKCNVFTKFPLYDCYPDNVYHSPCFCRLPFTSPRLSRFAHAVQILHTVIVLHCRRFTSRDGFPQGGCTPSLINGPGPMQGFHFKGFFPF